MYKKILRILPFALALLLVLSVSFTTRSVAAQSQEDHILQQITSTYKAALKASNRYSFHGYCGAFVSQHLHLLGINSSLNTGNGNDQYDMYKNLKYSTGGHRIEALPASKYTLKEALNYLSNNGTEDVYNILIGFQKTNTTAGKKYGHATFIHAILDGKVYYSESFSLTMGGKRHSEGTPVVCTIDQFCKYYSSWTTYEGTIHFGLKTYQDKCEYLPAYLYATVTGETQLYSAACTPDVDESSEVIRTLLPGERLSITGMYCNTKGEYWYQVEDAQVGYVPASQTQLESMRYDDVTVSDISAPTEQRKGNVFNIKGIITSTYNNICSVRAQVFTISEDGLSHWMTTTDTVVNNYYSLSYSVVSDKMAFRQLKVGTYRYEMAVVVSNNYFADGMLQTEFNTLKLWCSDFKVVSKKGNTVSVKFNTDGGTASLNAAELQTGATIGTLPEATREGYEFLGWYTAPEGGELVHADYVVEADITLYARWAEDTNITGWFQEDGKLYYLIEGQRITGFFQVDDITYYQTEDGFLTTGWMLLNDTYYYFNTNGSMVLGWFEIGDLRYYFGTDGSATIGWAEIDGHVYYFDEHCAMLTGTQTIDGVTYNFSETGELIVSE